MTTAAVFGCTGGVGSHILSTLLGSDAFISVKTISRRLPKAQSPKLEAHQEADISKWGGMISNLSPKPSAVFNAVGTTRTAAGGIQNQWKIDHDLCVENAKAAKEASVKTYVFVSGGAIRSLPYRYVPYSKMKIGVEDAIKELDFEQAVILRPGMILGERETPKSPFLENFFGSLHKISPSLQDMLGMILYLSSVLVVDLTLTSAVDQKIIGRAAVAAVRLAQEGKAPSKYWVLEQADIIKYGRDEWKE